jgi:DNA-binding NtrC family response regulator
MARILIVDDEANMRRILSALLKGDGHAVTEADGVAAALAAVAASAFDLVITDQKMKDGEGLQVLSGCQDADPALPVVMLTAFTTVELAIDALRLGAFDFLTKPFSPDAVRAVVKRAVERTRLRRENQLLKHQVDRLGFTADLLGDSAPMRQVKERIALVAPTNAIVLITGETGTGKELAARAIHKGSQRADGPFLPVNCAAFSETLLDSELFGHEKGAFTGADRSRPGWFEAADGGTLFLDEAGEMSLPLQAKLLRVLADHQIVRVGSRAPRSVDVRLILATHRDLKQRVAEGTFREDLFYRIAVVPVEMPPLRDRPADIAPLVEQFLVDAARELKVPRRIIDPAALKKLQGYAFPGNIRELRNLIERACILARGKSILPNDLPLGDGTTAADPDTGVDALRRFAQSMPASFDLRETLEQLEKALIARALEEAGGVQAEAARQLNLTRSDIGYKLRKHGLQPPDASEAS